MGCSQGGFVLRRVKGMNNLVRAAAWQRRMLRTFRHFHPFLYLFLGV
jgi:hypothetical protein